MTILKMSKLSILGAATAVSLSFGATNAAQAQAEPLLGQVSLFGFNFCPRGWAPANGALLPISANSALFSLLGTIYGGDGRTTFALPDLRGRAAVGAGARPGGQSYQMGQRGGTENIALSSAQLPAHNHIMNVVTDPLADQWGPGNDFLAKSDQAAGQTPIYHDGPATPGKQLNSGAISSTGGSQSFNIQDPYLTMSWCVATQGIFPSRN